jgi:hypothetical protein
LHDFWYETQKKAKKYTKEKELSGWKDMVVLKDFRPLYISQAVWVKYIQHVHLNVLCGNHTLVRKTGTSVFMILLQRTLATPFYFFRMQRG